MTAVEWLEENMKNKELLEYIEELESESFEGWSEDAISGYLTACKSIAEKFIAITIKENEDKKYLNLDAEVPFGESDSYDVMV